MSVTPAAPSRRLPPGARRTAVLELLALHPEGMSVAEVAHETGLHQNTVRAHLDALVRTGRAARRTDARGRPGRPRDLYTATGAPADARNYRLLAEMLATRLVELSPDPAADAVEAGRAWSVRGGSSAVVARGPHDAAVAADGPRAAADDADDSRDAVVDVPEMATPDAADPVPHGTPAPTGEAPFEAQVRPVLAVLTAAGFAPRLDAEGRRVELHHCPFRELALTAPDVVCGAHLGLIKGTLERSGAALDATRILPFVQPGLCVAELTDP